MPLRRGQSNFFVSIKENSDSVNGRMYCTRSKVLTVLPDWFV